MIIALHAKAGAGKDAFADRLVAKHGFLKRGFAAPLYEEVAHAFRVTVEWLQDRSRKELPQRELRLTYCGDGDFVAQMRDRNIPVTYSMSPRQVLQRWGTEYRRGQDDEYWIKQFAMYCKAAYETGAAGVAAPDCRFENEAEFVQSCMGEVLEIVRPGLAPVEGEHVSAKRLPDGLITRTIYNNGTLEQLHALADAALVIAQRGTDLEVVRL